MSQTHEFFFTPLLRAERRAGQAPERALERLGSARPPVGACPSLSSLRALAQRGPHRVGRPPHPPFLPCPGDAGLA